MVDFWGVYCKVAYKKYDYFYRNIYGMYLQDLKKIVFRFLTLASVSDIQDYFSSSLFLYSGHGISKLFFLFSNVLYL